MANYHKATLLLTLGISLCLPLHADRARIFPGTGGSDSTGPSSPADEKTLSGEVVIKNPEALRYPEALYSEIFEIEFVNEDLRDLELWRDYAYWVDCPRGVGPAELHIYGMGDYSGEIIVNVEILKGIIDIEPSDLSIGMPEETTYDGWEHPAYLFNNPGGLYFVYTSNDALIPSSDSYHQEAIETRSPVYPGKYDIWAECIGSDYYEDYPRVKVGEMTLYPVNTDEIARLESIGEELKKYGFTGFRWNTNYDSLNANRYSNRIYFDNGRICQLDMTYCFEHTSDEMPFPTDLLGFDALRVLSLQNAGIASDIGDIASTIAADPILSESAAHLYALDVADNSISGNLSAFGIAFPNLIELVARNNRLSDFTLPLPDCLQYVDFSCQYPDWSMSLDFNNLHLDEILSSLPTLGLFSPYQSGIPYSLALGISNNPDFQSSANGELFKADATLCNNYDGTYSLYPHASSGTYRGEMESTLYLGLSSYYSAGSGVIFPVYVTLIPYDVNFDFTVTVADIQAIANRILNKYMESAFNFTTADINKDDCIDARDLVLMTDRMLSMQPAVFADSRQYNARRIVSSDIDEQRRGRLFVESGNLYLECNTDVAAIDILTEGPEKPEWCNSLREAGLAVSIRSSDHTHRMMAYSPSGATLPEGCHLLASNFSGTPTGGSLSDAEARMIPLHMDAATGIGMTEFQGISASLTGQTICLKGAAGATWRLLTLSGISLAEGMAETDEYCLPAVRQTSSPLILVVSDVARTISFKL